MVASERKLMDDVPTTTNAIITTTVSIVFPPPFLYAFHQVCYYEHIDLYMYVCVHVCIFIVIMSMNVTLKRAIRPLTQQTFLILREIFLLR